MSFEDGAKQHSFDLVALEDAMKESYIGTKCTKLAATILLMNLCTIHGVNNKFANELLHLQLLLEVGSYYVARILNQNLGLNYNNIHACAKGCVFFQGNHKDTVHCPKCGRTLLQG
jgi:ribosomal protein S27AE